MINKFLPLLFISTIGFCDKLHDTKIVTFVNPSAEKAKDVLNNLVKNEEKAVSIHPYELSDLKTIRTLNRPYGFALKQTIFNVEKINSEISTSETIIGKRIETNLIITGDSNVISNTDKTAE